MRCEVLMMDLAGVFVAWKGRTAELSPAMAYQPERFDKLHFPLTCSHNKAEKRLPLTSPRLTV